VEPVLRVHDAPHPDDVAHVQSRVHDETVARAAIGPDRDLAVEARDGDGGEMLGACYGGTWGGTCELEGLWVRPDQRRNGLGSRLLAEAEFEASRRGCLQVVLLTHELQAPGFYEQRGYDVVGRVDGYPDGSAALWFHKTLVPDPTGTVRESS